MKDRITCRLYFAIKTDTFGGTFIGYWETLDPGSHMSEYDLDAVISSRIRKGVPFKYETATGTEGSIPIVNEMCARAYHFLYAERITRHRYGPFE